MPYIESLDEFTSRVGSKPLFAKNRYVYENGAWSDGRNHVDPSSDPRERARVQHAYYSEMLKREIRHYNEMRKAVQVQADFHRVNMGDSPDIHYPDWRERMSKAAEEIQALRSKASELEDIFIDKERTYRPFEEQRQRKETVKAVLRDLSEFPSFSLQGDD